MGNSGSSLVGGVVTPIASLIEGGASTSISQCLVSAVGSNVRFPTDLLYGVIDVHPYNLDVSVAPIAVTYPSTADQVAAIVKCAGSDFKIQARGGGHSYANYGSSLQVLFPSDLYSTLWEGMTDSEYSTWWRRSEYHCG